MAGGIFGLLGLIAAHRGAVEYDWRTRFGLGLDDIGVDQSLQEAARLAEILREDPSSAISAVLRGWEHPVSREALVLMDVFDLNHMVAAGGKKVKPHAGRPGQQGRKVEKRGKTTLSREEALALLRSAGHTAPEPEI